jgi:hypothetical protein
MPATLTIRDESLGGAAPLHEWALEVLTERLTVRELIRSRVYQEVQDHNRQQSAEFRGLVQPEGAERTLNGWRLKQARPIDWKQQFEKALEAFEGNRVVILINDRQAEALDEEFEVRPDTAVTFLRLTPLVGG